VSLGPKRVLWIFGDTIIGTLREGKREGSMINNSIAIQEWSDSLPGKVDFYWDLTDRVPGSFFHPDSFDKPYWFWPGTGVTINNTTYLFLARVERDKNIIGGLSFQVTGCYLFKIKNIDKSPEGWDISTVDLGYGNNHFNVNTAALIEDGYVYLLGYYDGPENKPLERVAILCRLPIDKLEAEKPGEALQFWSMGNQWLTTPQNLQPLFQPGTTESSLYFDPVRKRYIASVIKPFSSDYFLFNAEKLTGPWSEPQKVYDIPDLKENKLYHAYAGRIHPMLASHPDELVLSYVVNTTDFWSMFSIKDIYYPRFIKVYLGTPEK
ncbi:MAG: DUF4185 domain-containing protein, partial [Candidatus Sumerlaeia bacterium]|nr:DUF4185 domain-containing protein [Candidatus Sumerlaeia bacterium]